VTRVAAFRPNHHSITKCDRGSALTTFANE
jgi:hypothetical protein